MSTTFSYVNNFNISVGSATSTTTGTGVGIAQGSNTDTDTEYVFYSGRNEGATLDLNANMATGHRINDFTASMQLDFWAINQTGTQYGNRNPDGFSFSYGNPATLNTNREYGLSTGLTVQILPFDFSTNGVSMNILWNGAVIGQTPPTGFALNNPAATLSISVNTAGQVSASWGSLSATGTIAGNQWLTTSQNGWDYILAGRTGDNGDGVYIDNLAVNSTEVCFAKGTRILTTKGDVAVEDLLPGDLVITRDHGPQPLLWRSHRNLSSRQLAANPKLRPIRIAKGSLGDCRPSSDLTVSPQHRVLASGPICRRMFDAEEVLVAAKNLTAIPGVAIDTEVENVSYYHLLFDRHEIIFALGAPAESLLTGLAALSAMSPLQLGEIVALVPAIINPDFRAAPARPIPKSAHQRKLVTRALRNSQSICATG
jgi:Hint domain